MLSKNILKRYMQDVMISYFLNLNVKPRTMCHLYVHISTRRYLYTKFSIYDHLSETIVDIRDDKWFVHIRMLLYPAISL